MTQIFLSEPSIAEAHKKYLESWGLPSVRAAWKNRKPSLKQFEDRFGEAYASRQSLIDTTGMVRNAVLDERRVDDIQGLVEAVEEGVEAVLSSLTPPRFAALDADVEPETQETSAPEVRTGEGRTVKKKNRDKLPTAKQLYFYLHRARELGHNFVTIPTTMGEAARGRSLMADGMAYPTAIIELRKTSDD